MSENSGLFDEFTVVKPQKSKLFDVVTILSISFVTFSIIDLAIDLQDFSLKRFEWGMALLVLGLPCVGLLFHLWSKKAGWIINCFYYSFVSMAALYLSFMEWFGKNGTPTETPDWRAVLALLLVSGNMVVLLLKPIRKYFRISTLLLVSILIAAICLAVILIVMNRR